MDLNKYACTCANVTYGQIIQAIDRGAGSFEEVSHLTGCGRGCGTCRDFIEHFIRQLQEDSSVPKG